MPWARLRNGTCGGGFGGTCGRSVDPGEGGTNAGLEAHSKKPSEPSTGRAKGDEG